MNKWYLIILFDKLQRFSLRIGNRNNETCGKTKENIFC